MLCHRRRYPSPVSGTRAGAVGDDGEAGPPGRPGGQAEAFGTARGRLRPAGPRRWIFVVAALAAWAAACGVLLVQAVRAAQDGVDAAQAAKELRTPGDLVSGRTGAPLRKAAADFGRARRALRHPLLAPLRIVPIGGRQLRSATALAAAAAEVSRTGAAAIDGARAAFDAPHESGAERVALLRRLSALSGEAGRRLDGVRLGPEDALLEVLADRRDELAADIADVRATLATAEAVSSSLAGVFEGPARYLLLATNNAEMRAGSGMVLSLAEAAFGDGTVRVENFRTVAASTLQAGAEPAIADADLAARWGWLSPNREWRNLATTPRFEATAALAADMWAATGRGRVDGVLAVDPVALEAILAATGPVEVEGRTVSAGTVVEFLLHDQYVESAGDPTQTERRELLSAIAAAAVGALERGEVDLPVLADGLAAAARGRHFLAWSPRPADARGWAAARVEGRLEADSLALAVLNQSGTKLDPFLKVDADLSVARSPGGTAVVLEVRVANRVPDGEPAYVAGPFPGSGVGANVYTGLVSVNVPANATDLSVDDHASLAAYGPDGPTFVAAVPVTVGQGESAVVRFRYIVPALSGRLVVEPTARVPAVEWRGPGGAFEDDGHIIRWNAA